METRVCWQSKVQLGTGTYSGKRTSAVEHCLTGGKAVSDRLTQQAAARCPWLATTTTMVIRHALAIAQAPWPHNQSFIECNNVDVILQALLVAPHLDEAKLRQVPAWTLHVQASHE